MTGIHPITRQRARKLRHEMTPQERLVWAKLRELNRMLGLHFRRQAPIGPFIADFADLGRRVVIEIDGGGHGGPRDQRRDEWLSARGLRVLRFWNLEVTGNIEGVVQLVLDAIDGESLADAPHPRPSPTRGEGGSRIATYVSGGSGVPPSPGPSPREGGEVPAAGVEHSDSGLAPPSPRVGEGWGGGASGKGIRPEGSTP